MSDKDCKDFSSQQAAQQYFASHGGTPSFNFNNLDHNHNGVACEDYPYSQQTTATTSVQQGGALPRTGAATVPEAVGGSLLLLVGFVSVLISRRLRRKAI